MGAEAFAQRARMKLLAIGERARPRSTPAAEERLSPAVAARIVAETGGNPLALTEVVQELSPGQLAGAEALPEPLPAGGSLEDVFGRRVRRLPAETRLLLAVAAAEPTASQALLWRAAGELGIDPDSAASAQARCATARGLWRGAALVRMLACGYPGPRVRASS